MKNQSTQTVILIVFLSLRAWTQSPDMIGCSSSTISTLFNENFQYDSTSDNSYPDVTNTLESAGWSGNISDSNKTDQNDPYPGKNKWGIVYQNQRTLQTGPSNLNDQRYLMFESASGEKSGELFSPEIDLSIASEKVVLSFMIHAFGKDVGDFKIKIADDISGEFKTLFVYNASDNSIIDKTKDEWNFIELEVPKEAWYSTAILQFTYKPQIGSKNDCKGDIAIDDVRIQTCGNVCAPGTVSFINTNHNTSQIDWKPVNTSVDFEYVLNNAGSSEPQGSGTIVESNEVNNIFLADLEPETSYDFWYRAKCASNSFSAWNKKILTTTKQFVFIINPGEVVSLPEPYCYSKKDIENKIPDEYTFKSSNGAPIVLNFLKGNSSVYFGYKKDYPSSISRFLNVDDGNDNRLDGQKDKFDDYTSGRYKYSKVYEWFDYSGAFFESDELSDSDELSFHLTSGNKYQNTCADIADHHPWRKAKPFEPIQVEAYIKSCELPKVNYEIDFSCEAAISEFYVKVHITNLGDFSEFSIENTINDKIIKSNTVGEFSIGPFEIGSNQPQIVIKNKNNSNCFLRSVVFNPERCKPANDDIENAKQLEVGGILKTDEFNRLWYDYENVDSNVDLIHATPELDAPAVSNGYGFENNDVWFKFNAKYNIQQIAFQFKDGDWLDGNEKGLIPEGEQFNKAGYKTDNGHEGGWGIPAEHIDLSVVLYKHVKGESFSDLEELFIYNDPYSGSSGQKSGNRPYLLTPFLEISDSIDYYIRVYSNNKEPNFEEFDIAVIGSEQMAVSSISDSKSLCDMSNYENGIMTVPSTIGIRASNFANVIDSNKACKTSDGFPIENYMINPTWLTFEVSKRDKIVFDIELTKAIENNPQNTYADFRAVVYGPFDSKAELEAFNYYNQTTLVQKYITSGACGGSEKSIQIKRSEVESGKFYLLGLFNHSGFFSEANSPSGGWNDSNYYQNRYINWQPEFPQQYNISLNAASEAEFVNDVELELGDDIEMNCSKDVVLISAFNEYSRNIDRVEWYFEDVPEVISTSNTLEVREPGLYSVIAYNSCDQFEFDSIQVTKQASELLAEVTTSDICGDSGEATFVINGTNGAEVTYAIGNGADQTLVLGIEPTSIAVQITEDTTLVIKEITDGLCTEILTASAEAKLIPYTDLTPLTLDAFCSGDPSPLTETIDGYTGIWTPAYNATQTTTYTFIPDTVDGMCFNTLDVTVEVWDVVSPTFDAVDAVCEGASSPLPNVSNEGYPGVWTPSYDATQTQTYTFTANAQSGICFEQPSLTVIVNEEIEPTFDLDFSDPVCLNTNLEAFPSISNEGISGSWSPETGSSMAGEVTYYFTPDASYCAMETYVTVSYVQCEVPEGISPNGDAYNQYFDLSTFGVKRLEIYNRYGKLVYSRNNYKKEWYGQDSGNGALPVGTYFYIIKLEDNTQKTGSVYLNR